MTAKKRAGAPSRPIPPGACPPLPLATYTTGHVVASLNKALYDDYICLVALNK